MACSLKERKFPNTKEKEVVGKFRGGRPAERPGKSPSRKSNSTFARRNHVDERRGISWERGAETVPDYVEQGNLRRRTNSEGQYFPLERVVFS